MYGDAGRLSQLWLDAGLPWQNAVELAAWATGIHAETGDGFTAVHGDFRKRF